MSQDQRNPDVEADVAVVEPAEAVDTAPPEQPVLQDQVQQLQDQLQQAQAKAEENWNHYLSARAEADNIRKRSEREIQNAHKFALKDFIDALLPVRDSLEKGIAAATEAADIDKLREGSELTLKMLDSVLEKAGVQALDPAGVKFNPEFHEAMVTQPSDQVEPNTVLQVIQKGYLLNDRLIRPARVIVSRTPE